jgi:hypothetical protein
MPDGALRVSDICDFYLIGTRLRLLSVTTGDQVVRKLGQKVRLEKGTRRIAHTTMECSSRSSMVATTRSLVAQPPCDDRPLGAHARIGSGVCVCDHEAHLLEALPKCIR